MSCSHLHLSIAAFSKGFVFQKWQCSAWLVLGRARCSLEEAYPQRKYLEIEGRSLRSGQADTNSVLSDSSQNELIEVETSHSQHLLIPVHPSRLCLCIPWEAFQVCHKWGMWTLLGWTGLELLSHQELSAHSQNCPRALSRCEPSNASPASLRSSSSIFTGLQRTEVDAQPWVDISAPELPMFMHLPPNMLH